MVLFESSAHATETGIMARRVLAAVGLLLIDAGAFVLTFVLLPLKGSWGHSGPWSYFVNSRDRQDIAWGVLVAALILSAGAYLLMEALGVFGEGQKPPRSVQ
jgi:hypothetical protein